MRSNGTHPRDRHACGRRVISVAALRALVAAGATATMLVDAIEAEMAGSEKKLEARRAKDAERQRQYRSRTVTRSHTESHVTACDGESALSILPSLSESQQQKPKEEKKERAKRDRGHVCPDDLHPSESHFEAGLKQSVSRQRVEACCEAMKSWSKSNSHRAVARKVDWNAALFGWIDREAERTGKGNGHGNNGFSAAAERLRARGAEFERQDDPGKPDELFERHDRG